MVSPPHALLLRDMQGLDEGCKSDYLLKDLSSAFSP